MDRQERKDARLWATGEGLFGVGFGLIAPLTVLPLLIRDLGGGPVEIGLLTAIATAGFLLTQPIGMLLCRHGAGKMRFVLPYSASVTLSSLVAIGLVVLYLGARPETHRLARILVIGLFALRVLGIGAIVPIWQDWTMGLFSPRSRGRALGMAFAVMSLGVSAGSLLASRIRGSLGFPNGYALLFILAFCFASCSYPPFVLMRSGRPRPGSEGRPRVSELLGLFGHSLRNATYRSYLIGRVLLTLGAGASGFIALHFGSESGGGVPKHVVIALGALLPLLQAVGSFPLGIMGDRRGHKRGVLTGCVAQIAALVIAVLGKGAFACAMCFVCMGLAIAASVVSHLNMIFETCPHDNRIAHITLSSLILGPFLALVCPATGWLIQHVGMTAGIALCLVPTVLGTLWIFFMVREPRRIVLGVAAQDRDVQ